MQAQLHPLTRLVHGDDYVSPTELAERVGSGDHGDADFYVLVADLVARYQAASSWEIFLDVPYKAETLRVGEQDAHHRDQTFQGLGDIRLGAKYFPLIGRAFQLGTLLGVSLPTGARSRLTRLSFVDHEQAEALGIIVPEHGHLQLGNGTLEPLLGLEAFYRLDERWSVFAATSMSVPLYSSDDGYQTAPSGTVQAGPAVTLGTQRLLLSLAVEALLAGRDHLEAADVEGTKGSLLGDLDVPNTGRLEIALAPGVTWWATETLSLTLRLRVPVYTRIPLGSAGADVQLTEPVGVTIGIARDFGQVD